MEVLQSLKWVLWMKAMQVSWLKHEVNGLKKWKLSSLGHCIFSSPSLFPPYTNHMVLDRREVILSSLFVFCSIVCCCRWRGGPGWCWTWQLSDFRALHLPWTPGLSGVELFSWWHQSYCSHQETPGRRRPGICELGLFRVFTFTCGNAGPVFNCCTVYTN